MKRKKQTTRILISVLACLVLVSSCTITENISFKQTGYHTSEYAFTVEDFFIAVLEDFSEFASEEEDISEMDKAMEDFEKALQYSSATRNVALKKLDEHSYEGVFEFSDLQRLITDLGAGEDQSLLDIGEHSITFFLSLDNYDQLVPVIPFLADENFEAFGPVYNQGLSEADYLEMISFMLGEEGPPAIERSVITLRVNTPKEITSFSNGKKVAQRVYEFSFPLIDFLLLPEPITFTVCW